MADESIAQECLQLRLALEEAKRNADTLIHEANVRADTLIHEANVRADTLIHEANVRADTEKARTDKLLSDTTLNEFIALSHNLVFTNLIVESNNNYVTKGIIPPPTRKWCPTKLTPWSDFLDQQRDTFTTLCRTFPLQSRLFKNPNILADIGKTLSAYPIGDEKTLEFILHLSVEDLVRHMIDAFQKSEQTRQEFNIGDRIVFNNHVHVQDFMENRATQAPKAVASATTQTPQAAQTPQKQKKHPNRPENPQTPTDKVDLNQLRPDQICVYRSSKGEPDTMLYVCEYKPPHKLTAEHFHHGLHPMNIYKDVANKKTIPTDEIEKGKHDAEALTASAITQIFHYMIEGGLEYGILTTGEAFVFLKIDWEHPGTLLYHFFEPLREPLPSEDEPPDLISRYISTAVGQYLAFTLLTLSSRAHGHDERKRAKKKLDQWVADFESTSRSLRSTLSMSPNDSEYKGTVNKLLFRSPYFTRSKRNKNSDNNTNTNDDDDDDDDDDANKKKRKRETCLDPNDEPLGKHPRDDDDRDDYDDMQNTPTRSRRFAGSGGGSSSKTRLEAGSKTGSGAGSRTGSGTASKTRSERLSMADLEEALAVHQDRKWEYCTQKCLLGLVKGDVLDPACPNVVFHNKNTHTTNAANLTRHQISHEQFLQLLRCQLEKTLDRGIALIGKGGACSVLLKTTLLVYGYTFVCKGTVSRLIGYLEHEAAVYKRLEPIQGRHVPVLLGAVDLLSLGRTYFYDFGASLVYLMFMSWGGDVLYDDLKLDPSTDKSLKDMATKSLQAVHSAGVVHTDVRLPNMLFNREVNTVMIIDFEGSLLLDPPRQLLEKAGSKNSKRLPRGSKQKAAAKANSGDSFSCDLSMMASAFSEYSLLCSTRAKK